MRGERDAQHRHGGDQHAEPGRAADREDQRAGREGALRDQQAALLADAPGHDNPERAWRSAPAPRRRRPARWSGRARPSSYSA